MKSMIILILFLGLFLTGCNSLSRSDQQLSETKEIEFFTEYTTKQIGVSPGNMGVSVIEEVIFTYKGKEYKIEVINNYTKSPECEQLTGKDCGEGSRWMDSAKIQDGKIKIKGKYDSRANTLYDYSLA